MDTLAMKRLRRNNAMNSSVVNAPFAIIGIRDASFTQEQYVQVSDSLNSKFQHHLLWPSLIRNKDNASGVSLCFFPLATFSDDYQQVADAVKSSSALTVLDDAPERASFWIRCHHYARINVSVMTYTEFESYFTSNNVPQDEIRPMLDFLHESGRLFWITFSESRSIIIFNPYSYFVNPATIIINSELTLRNHCDKAGLYKEEIHLQCQRDWPDDWLRMLEFGLVTERLARRLLKSRCENDEHVTIVIKLMEEFAMMLPFKFPELTPDSSDVTYNIDPGSLVFLVPCLFQQIPDSVDSLTFSAEHIALDQRELARKKGKIVNCVHMRKGYLQNFPTSESFYFAFTISTEAARAPLLSFEDMTEYGFLPGGLYERFIGRMFESVLSSPLKFKEVMERNEFVLFRTSVMLKILSTDIRVSVLPDYGLIRVDVANSTVDSIKSGEIVLLHDILFEKLRALIQEMKISLYVVTVLSYDISNDPFPALLPLAELKYLVENKVEIVRNISMSGKKSLGEHVRYSNLVERFRRWLQIDSIHPKKGNLLNEVIDLLFAVVFN
jgi:hypothetical protein